MIDPRRNQYACGCIYYGETLYEGCDEYRHIKGRIAAALERLERSGKSVQRRVVAQHSLDAARAELGKHC